MIRFVVHGSLEHMLLLFKDWKETHWIRVPGSPTIVGLQP